MTPPCAGWCAGALRFGFARAGLPASLRRGVAASRPALDASHVIGHRRNVSIPRKRTFAVTDPKASSAAATAEPERPSGVVSIRTVAMPADTNPAGDIFGGWVMSQMDLAGGTHARLLVGGRVATVAVDGFVFHRPLRIGDQLTCYTRYLRCGRTSLTLSVEAWARRGAVGDCERVTEGTFVFVAIDGEGRPRAVPDDVEAREAALLAGG